MWAFALDRECTETTQLDPFITRQRRRDLTEDDIDDHLDVPLIEMPVAREQPFNKLGFRYCGSRARFA